MRQAFTLSRAAAGSCTCEACSSASRYPGSRRPWTASRSSAAASHIAAAHQRARLMAVTQSMVTVLSVDCSGADHSSAGSDRRRSGPRLVPPRTGFPVAGPRSPIHLLARGVLPGSLQRHHPAHSRQRHPDGDHFSPGKSPGRRISGRTSGGRRPLRADDRPGGQDGSGPPSPSPRLPQLRSIERKAGRRAPRCPRTSSARQASC